MTNLYEYKPNYAVHPGETLKEKLEELGMSPTEFAIRTGKPIKTISNLINGKSSITPEMAVQFEKVLKIPARFWLKHQADFDEFSARLKHDNELKTAIEWAKKFPYAAMSKLGWVKKTRKPEEKASELLTFFGISKVKSWEDIYLNEALPLFLRISLKHEKDPYAFSAWLAKGEQVAKSIEAPDYSPKYLRKILPELKKIMVFEPTDFFKQAQSICLNAGIKLLFTPTLPKVPINGVVRWIDSNPIIQIYDRYKRYDIFWFSLFHELGHILLHGNRKNIFFEDAKYFNQDIAQEKEADMFASQWLLKNEEYQIILNEVKNANDPIKVIQQYAKKFETHPDIIIGRILHENKILYKLGFLQNQLTKIDIERQPKLF